MAVWAVEHAYQLVALRKESVDRNILFIPSITLLITVALRKESVDRNTYYIGRFLKMLLVALRKESVDRNVSVAQTALKTG